MSASWPGDLVTNHAGWIYEKLILTADAGDVPYGGVASEPSPAILIAKVKGLGQWNMIITPATVGWIPVGRCDFMMSPNVQS